MDMLDIVTPGFSLDNMDNINETLTNSINDININSSVEDYDYTFYIYIGILFCVVFILVFIFKFYIYNKKSVTIREDNNENYIYS